MVEPIVTNYYHCCKNLKNLMGKDLNKRTDTVYIVVRDFINIFIFWNKMTKRYPLTRYNIYNSLYILINTINFLYPAHQEFLSILWSFNKNVLKFILLCWRSIHIQRLGSLCLFLLSFGFWLFSLLLLLLCLMHHSNIQCPSDFMSQIIDFYILEFNKILEIKSNLDVWDRTSLRTQYLTTLP